MPEDATIAPREKSTYEYSNKKALDALAEDYHSGKITADEYQRRKKEIENRWLIY